MKLTISLVILNLYMLADTCLTAFGLKLGLQEMNPLVNVDKLFLHYIVCFTLIAITALAAYELEKYQGWKNITRSVVLFVTMSYVGVLAYNISVIHNALFANN